MKVNLEFVKGVFYPLEDEDFEKVKELSNGTKFEVTLVQPGDLLSHYSVFWIWMRAISKQLYDRGWRLDPDHPEEYDQKKKHPQAIHDLVCHRYLGYVPPRKIGKTQVEASLRTLTYPEPLTTDEMYSLLRQIEEWAAEVGVMLPAKPSQYSEERERAG